MWLFSKPSSPRKLFFPQINPSPNLFSFMCVPLFRDFFFHYLKNTCDSRISWQDIPFTITAGVYLPHPDYVECICRSEGLISCWLLCHPCLACFLTLGGPRPTGYFASHLYHPFSPHPILQALPSFFYSPSSTNTMQKCVASVWGNDFGLDYR